MPRSKLDNLVRSGLLKEEASARAEIAGLIESGRERLAEEVLVTAIIRIAREMAARLGRIELPPV